MFLFNRSSHLTWDTVSVRAKKALETRHISQNRDQSHDEMHSVVQLKFSLVIQN